MDYIIKYCNFYITLNSTVLIIISILLVSLFKPIAQLLFLSQEQKTVHETHRSGLRSGGCIPITSIAREGGGKVRGLYPYYFPR